MAEASLERALIWDDLATFDGKSLRGKVHIVSAGVPCQAYSLAGKQEGNTDKRSWGEGDGPIPHVLRIIVECQPALVIFECVSAWVRSSEQFFRPVGEKLCGMGWTLVEPVFIAASDVGASHERERVFILAYSESEVRRCGFRQGWAQRDGRSVGGSQPEMDLADTEREPGSAEHEQGPRERQDRGAQHGTMPGKDGDQLAYAGRAGLQGHAGDGNQRDQPGRQHKGQAGSIAASGPNMDFAPGPGAGHIWRGIIANFPHLAPAVEPGFRVLLDGTSLVLDASRADQLRCIGNGCVPLQAATAIAILLKRAGLGHLIDCETISAACPEPGTPMS